MSTTTRMSLPLLKSPKVGLTNAKFDGGSTQKLFAQTVILTEGTFKKVKPVSVSVQFPHTSRAQKTTRMAFSKTVVDPLGQNSPLKSGRLHQKRVSFQDELKKQAPKEFLKRKSQRAFPLPITPR